MTTFKFNFSGSQEEEKNKDENEEIEWFECEEINIEEEIKKVEEVNRAKIFNCNDVDICYVHQRQHIFINGHSEINPLELADREHSDLIAGKYEGGLKVWECTNDLIKYLMENQDTISFDKLKVLDLGCGVGILGIYALLNGSSVTFQDYGSLSFMGMPNPIVAITVQLNTHKVNERTLKQYNTIFLQHLKMNKEIISYITLPSVLLNIEDDEDREKKLLQCKFYSGDWASFNKKLSDADIYDIILTSETIYNESNYKKLIELFLKRLSKNGNVFLAAKTCYFGVGGGLRQFETCIKRTELLHSEVVWKSAGGIQREIIKIKRLQ